MRRISIHRKADRKDPAFGYVNRELSDLFEFVCVCRGSVSTFFGSES